MERFVHRDLKVQVKDGYTGQRLLNHIRRWGQCTQCPLGLNPDIIQKVIFRGYLPCEVLFIGEAPGKSENANGYPFSNPLAAGGVFDKIIEETLKVCPRMGDNWAVTNAVLCLPPDEVKKQNTGELTIVKEVLRAPTMQEVKACNERLQEFVTIAMPKIIVHMGSVAEKACRTIIPVTPPFFTSTHIAHPSWMQREPQDVNLEIRRAVHKVKDCYVRLQSQGL